MISLFLSAMWGYQEKTAICKPERRILSGTKLDSILVLDFLASTNVRIKYLLFKQPSLWQFVKA